MKQVEHPGELKGQMNITDFLPDVEEPDYDYEEGYDADGNLKNVPGSDVI